MLHELCNSLNRQVIQSVTLFIEIKNMTVKIKTT